MFDQVLINKNKKKSALHVKNSDFFRFVYADLIDRLGPIDRVYQDVLWLGWGAHYPEFFTRYAERSEAFGGSASQEIRTTFLLPDEVLRMFADDGLGAQDNSSGAWNIKDKKFDLICFPFGLHWIDDVQKFLRQIKSLLNSDGIFIGNFPGGGSLGGLRNALFLAEESANTGHFLHISPFIRFEDVRDLLGYAGFAENIIDFEHLSLEYDSPIALMRDLKKLGESNAIASRSYYSITKSMYKFLQDCHPHAMREDDNKLFQDQVNLITLIACPTKHSIKLKSEHFPK